MIVARRAFGLSGIRLPAARSPVDSEQNRGTILLGVRNPSLRHWNVCKCVTDELRSYLIGLHVNPLVSFWAYYDRAQRATNASGVFMPRHALSGLSVKELGLRSV